MSFYTLTNKFLKEFVGDIKNVLDAHPPHSLIVPSPFSDAVLIKYFGDEKIGHIKEVFGCESVNTIECAGKLDRFLTSYG